MQLHINAINNLKTLLTIALQAEYKNIRINKTDMFDFTFMCNFTHEISIDCLKRVNEYFKTDIREKILSYSLIVNKNSNTIKLSIEGIENKQIDFLSTNDEICDKISKYNKEITNRLVTLKEYLFETLYPTDTELYNWTFYFIPTSGEYIGFANADLQNKSAIKIPVSNFNHYLSYYDKVYMYRGTLNDVKVITMRRNYNSNHGANWNYCLYGTPISELRN